MKKLLSIILACICLTGCSKYETYRIDGAEAFNVSIKASDYIIENPTDSIFTISDSNNRIATVQFIESAIYNIHKQKSNQAFKELQYMNRKGFSYQALQKPNNTTIYIRCFELTDNTAIYMESLISDDILDEVLDLFKIQ